MNRKKVLIIAYLFPPIGGGGVQRALKMAKYLGQFGVDVSVLTVENPNHVSLDQSLLEQIPESVTIYRAPEWKIPGMGAGGGGGTTSANAPSKPSVKGKILKAAKPLLKKVKEAVLIPDDQKTWYSSAVKMGLEIVDKEGIDVVFSTSGPYTNHLIGQAIKKKRGIQWIADFRDPWTQNMHRPEMKWRCHIEEKMEASVIEESDILMTVTHTFADNFKQKYGSKIKRLEVIHNGFDPEDYTDLKETKLYPEKWTFVYTGIFYAERNPRLFLRCVAELIEEGKIEKEDVSIQFAGVFDYPGYTENQDCVNELGLENNVYVWGNLPHKDALSLLSGADQLLLIGDVSEDSGAYIPGKLFEYMAVKKPIFALTVDGESARIITKQKIGRVIPPFDKQKIKENLLVAYGDWKNKSMVTIDTGNTIQYQRNEQARMLADVIFNMTTPK